MKKLLSDGDSAYFGRYRSEVVVYTDGEDKVLLEFDRDMTMNAQDLRELADWLTREVAPSIGNIYESAHPFEGEEEEEEEEDE